MPTLFAVTYTELDQARQAMELVDWANFDKQVDVKAACWITNQDGEVTVHPHGHPVGTKAALTGGMGLLVGALFGVPVVGLAAGSAIGARRAKHHATVLDEDFVARIKAEVANGGSAIVVLYEPGADTSRAAGDLSRLGGTIHSTDISASDLEEIQKRLDSAEASGEA